MARTDPEDIASRIRALNAIPAKERSLEQKAELLDLKKQKARQATAKLTRQQAALKTLSRKERTHRLIELGGLIAKAELDTLDAAALYGALLAVKRTIVENSQVVADWKRHGGSALTAQAQADPRRPLVVTFATEPGDEIRKALKAFRLRWSDVMEHWEGNADPNVVKNAVGSLGVVKIVQRANQPAPAPVPSPPATAPAAPRPAFPVPPPFPGAPPRPGMEPPISPSPAIRREQT